MMLIQACEPQLRVTRGRDTLNSIVHHPFTRLRMPLERMSMTVTLIWLIAFAVILLLTVKSWSGALGTFFERKMPSLLLSGGDDRWVWCPAIAVLGATTVVRPVDMVFTVLLLALIVWLGKSLISWAMNRVKLH